MPSPSSLSSSSSSNDNSRYLSRLVWCSLIGYGIYWCGNNAYELRLHSIKEFGTVIHEFDPYFNWRATQYLHDNGWRSFVNWFDHKVWYPLGRPVGTTIYPGMQVTAVFIKNYLMGSRMSLNDICCYMPAWFGVFASALTGMLTYECSLPVNSSGSVWTFLRDVYQGGISAAPTTTPTTSAWFPSMVMGVVAMGIMSMIPAHMMRSVGGGYDNESIAVTAMMMTFWLWCRSLRDDRSWAYGIATGVAYFYMVAAWGGYVFVLNLIGLHAVTLVLMGRFSTKVYLAYSLFYVVGTTLAIQVPVVGWTPLKSLEQLGPAAVFCGYQVLQYCEIQRKRQDLSRLRAWLLRLRVALFVGALAGVLIFSLTPQGYFGPVSARIRGLFVKHTKTGNPLVDSVAEHQPASANAYYQYLQMVVYTAPVGYVYVLFNLGDSSSFLLVYGFVSYFFSSKMVRLVLLLGPIASALTGVIVGTAITKSIEALMPWMDTSLEVQGIKPKKKQVTTSDEDTKKEPKRKKPPKKNIAATNDSTAPPSSWSKLSTAVTELLQSNEVRILKQILAILFFAGLFFFTRTFTDYCTKMSHALSNPSIIVKGKLQTGKTVVVDDYRESYFWLRDNTPDHARILSWWDYGYQITGIANRTTLADGNTWNHEHIALLGKILTTDEEEGYEIARHLADYVLIWAGGGGDDLAKSPHLARIANSVYRDMCPDDPTCRAFGVRDKKGTPSAMMARSFLYKLHGHKLKPGVEADPNKFKEVFRSKYGKVRIFKILAVSKESKRWIKNNRECDVPGGWYCPGQYPPALKSVLAKRKDFAQLEDFNSGNQDDEYQQKYFENLNKKKGYAPPAEQKKTTNKEGSSTVDSLTSEELEKLLKDLRAKLTPAEIEASNKNWEDTEETTMMWELISEKSVAKITKWLSVDPIVGFMRSSDGRGPMWWAYENRYMEVAVILTKLGVSNTLKDKYGKTPIDLLTSGGKKN